MDKRFQRHLFARFFIRFHTLLIFSGVILSGVIFNRLLLGWGLTAMGARYAVSLLLSYFTFYLLVGLWLRYLRANLSPHPTLTGEGGVDEERHSPSDDLSGLADAADFALGFDSAEGLFLLVIGAVLFGAGIYLVVEAPIILVEAAFQMALSAGLIKRARAMDKPGWSGHILKRTILPFLGILVCAFFVGAYLQGSCPKATKMVEAIQCEDRSERSSPPRP